MTLRHLGNSRTAVPDPFLLEGFDPTAMEGELPAPGVDGIASLRPFGRAIPEPRVVRPEGGNTAAEVAVFAALGLAERGRRLEAIQALRQIVDDYPSQIEPLIALGDLLAATAEFESAVEVFGAAIEAAARPAALLVRRGALHAQLGRPGVAEGDFREAIKRDATYWLAYRYLGALRLRMGAPVEAETVLRKALTLAPQDPDAVLHLGEALLLQGGRDEEAGQVLEQAVALLPTDPRGYQLLGRLLDRLGQTEKAMAMHRKSGLVGPE